MNSTNDKNTWIEQKARLKQKIIALIGSESLFDKSKRDEVMEKLQTKLGKTKDEVREILDTL